MNHPSCDHPITNATDDYSGVECCMCAGSPCPAVTPVLALVHDTFMASLFDYEPRDSLLPYFGAEDGWEAVR